MANYYKIEVEIVSDWVNYPNEQISELVKEAIENIRLSKIRVINIEFKEK
jgi:hypothetical protein